MTTILTWDILVNQSVYISRTPHISYFLWV